MFTRVVHNLNYPNVNGFCRQLFADISVMNWNISGFWRWCWVLNWSEL